MKTWDGGSTYYARCGMVLFDTSAIGGAEVTAATFRLNASTNETDGDAAFSIIGDYYSEYVGGAPIFEDYILTASGTSIFTARRLNTMTTGYNDFTVTDLSGINGSGDTSIRVTFDDGGAEGAPEGSNIITFVTGTSVWPQLEVTYTPVVPTTAYYLPPLRTF